MTYSSSSKSSVDPSNFAIEVVEKAGIIDPVTESDLLRAFTVIDRSKFIIAGYTDRVDVDVAVPIGFKQTSLKPSVLARMIGLIGIEKGMRVLEVGAGSGYGSAIMLSCGAEVFCIEREGLMAQQTRKRLDAMGFAKILFKAGEGLKGWPELAPFDAIMVTFPTEGPGEELLNQLTKTGGKLIGIFGQSGSERIWLYEKHEGEIRSYQLEGIE